MNKIVLTGPPGIGKTTLILEIISQINKPCRGFFTKELRKKGQRTGFLAESLTGKEIILAEKGRPSRWKLGRYGVQVKEFEEAILADISPPYRQNEVIVIDEIGKMECFSRQFCYLVEQILQSNTGLLATLGVQNHPFLNKVRRNND